MTSKKTFKKLAISTALMSFSAMASATVLTSIKPLGFIASSIANGVTDTQVLVPAGASPHDYSLKPSDVQKLKNAELVVWIGKDIDAFLDTSVLRNFPKNKLLTIADIPAINEDVLLTGHHHHHHHDHDEAHEEHHHDHDEAHEEHHHDHDEAHEEHHHDHDEAHEEHHHDHDEAHEEHHHDHDEAHEEHHHDHDEAHEEHHHELDEKGINWHIWYSPEISRIIAKNIAQKLTQDYPAKKQLIAKNLKEFNQSITETNKKIYKELKPVENKGFYVFHDAYTYFNKAYDLKQLGYFTINPLVAPGVKTLAKIKEEINEHKVQCLFAEPQFTPKVIKKLSAATGVKVGTLDPMGDKIALGKGSYAAFLQSMANSYLSCLK